MLESRWHDDKAIGDRVVLLVKIRQGVTFSSGQAPVFFFYFTEEIDRFYQLLLLFLRSIDHLAIDTLRKVSK